MSQPIQNYIDGRLVSSSTDELARIADILNKRPRPTLDLDTAGDRLNALLTAA